MRGKNMKIKKEKQLIPQVVIEQKIFLIRGKKVMLDSDLAVLYGVETKTLKRAVKRNTDRFPEDFMFQLTKDDCLTYIRQLNCGEMHFTQ